MTRIHTTAVSAIALLLAAGAATGQTGVRENNRENQTRQEVRQPGATPTRDANRTQDRTIGQRAGYNGAIHLMEAEDIIGADIHSPTGDSYGTVEDLIVDRGSGEIRFVVLRVNSVLGFGGDHLALAYHQLQWSNEDEGFRTSMTEEQAERQATNLPDDWNELKSVGWMNQIDPRQTNDRTRARTNDATRPGAMSELTGRISNVTRNSDTEQGDEMVVLEVLTETGETKEVVLGPSWYVMGQNNAPYRGQPIVVRGSEHDGRFVASSATIDGQEFDLSGQGDTWSNSGPAGQTGTNRPDGDRGRTQPGTDRTQTDRNETDRTPADRTRPDRTNPDRTNPDRTTPAGTTRNDDMTEAQREAERAALENTERRENYVERDETAAGNTAFGGRYFLLSNLDGAETQARRVRSGEVEAVIVEVGSGKIAFIEFDPNENFLGIGDEDILVPWSVVSFGQNRIVNIDSDAETIGRTAELPDDLDELRTTQSLAPIYQAYGSQMPDFRPAAQRNQGRDAMNRPTQDRRPGADRPADNRNDAERPARPARPANDRP